MTEQGPGRGGFKINVTKIKYVFRDFDSRGLARKYKPENEIMKEKEKDMLT